MVLTEDACDLMDKESENAKNIEKIIKEHSLLLELEKPVGGKLKSKPKSNLDDLNKIHINSFDIINFLARTDCMLYDDITDILKSVKRNYTTKGGDELYATFFKTRYSKNFDSYESYVNTDLKHYQYIDLKSEKEFIQIPPTIRQKTDIDEILYGNSFGSPLLCDDDILDPKNLAERIKDDVKNERDSQLDASIIKILENLAKKLESIKDTDLAADLVKTTLKEGLNDIIMDETLDQIETHEDLQTHIDKCMFKNINNKHEIRAYNQALDDFSGTLKKKSAYKDGELKKDNKAQLAHLVWGLNRLALEKLFPVGYIAPSYVFGAHPYVQSPRQNAPEKADDA